MHCDYLLTLLARPDFDRTKLPSMSPQLYPAPFTPPPDCALAHFIQVHLQVPLWRTSKCDALLNARVMIGAR